MDIKKIQVGIIDTNCYILSEGGETALIDPGDEAELILKELGNRRVKYIILTHCHFDHILACNELKSKTGAEVICHEGEKDILDNQMEIDRFIKEGDVIGIGNWKLEVIHTPGHTPGGICLLFEALAKNNYNNIGVNRDSPVLFSGDTIFKGTIGVTHYPGGDFGQIKDSIEKKLFILPDDTRVYPGHGEEFILGGEKENIKRVLEMNL